MRITKTKVLLALIAIAVLVAAVIVFPNLGDIPTTVRRLMGACESNPNPVFAVSPADLSKIAYIVPPGNVESYEGGVKVLKTHSYFKGPNKVEVRAPVDSALFRGVYVTEGGINQYALFFEVSCEVFYLLDHIVDPVGKIKDAFPDTPKTTTETINTPRIDVKAGELVGYSIGKKFEQWDFGVYNRTRDNDFSDLPSDVPVASRDRIADCPFDYFPKDLRQEFYAKFKNHLTGVPIPDRFCSVDSEN